jgi:hypothetical protein
MYEFHVYDSRGQCRKYSNVKEAFDSRISGDEVYVFIPSIGQKFRGMRP